MITQPTVKTIGANGQISLGKEFAGQQVLIEAPESGVWLIRTADVIPHNERWLHEPKQRERLDAALAWAVEHGASAANADEILDRLAREDDDA
ncbi:MAG: hypothetical protein K6G15_05730 [Desulfovibrio sp.]|nr:hypothetical protein [Desulfovibrio sp.]